MATPQMPARTRFAPGWSQVPTTPSRCPMWMAGVPSPGTLNRNLCQKWKSLVSILHSNIGCQCCKWQPHWLCHTVILSTIHPFSHPNWSSRFLLPLADSSSFGRNLLSILCCWKHFSYVKNIDSRFIFFSTTITHMLFSNSDPSYNGNTYALPLPHNTQTHKYPRKIRLMEDMLAPLHDIRRKKWLSIHGLSICKHNNYCFHELILPLCST